jgi:hypothetical protein
VEAQPRSPQQSLARKGTPMELARAESSQPSYGCLPIPTRYEILRGLKAKPSDHCPLLCYPAHCRDVAIPVLGSGHGMRCSQT